MFTLRAYLILGLTVTAGVGAAAPRLTEATVSRLEQLSAALPGRLSALEKGPSKRGLRQFGADLRHLKGGIAIYFHAPNLRDAQARPHVLRLRPLVASQLRGAEGMLKLGPDDRIRLRAAVADRLAQVALTLNLKGLAAQYARAALAAGPATPARQARLAQAEGRSVQREPLEVDEERAPRRVLERGAEGGAGGGR